MSVTLVVPGQCCPVLWFPRRRDGMRWREEVVTSLCSELCLEQGTAIRIPAAGAWCRMLLALGERRVSTFHCHLCAADTLVTQHKVLPALMAELEVRCKLTVCLGTRSQDSHLEQKCLNSQCWRSLPEKFTFFAPRRPLSRVPPTRGQGIASGHLNCYGDLLPVAVCQRDSVGPLEHDGCLSKHHMI